MTSATLLDFKHGRHQLFAQRFESGRGDRPALLFDDAILDDSQLGKGKVEVAPRFVGEQLPPLNLGQDELRRGPPAKAQPFAE